MLSVIGTLFRWGHLEWTASGQSQTANRKDPQAQCAAGLFYCGGVLLDGKPCGPTGASPGLSLRQQPLTMSPVGRLTCAE